MKTSHPIRQNRCTLILPALLLISALSGGCAIRNALKGPDREPIHHLSFHAFASNSMLGNITRVVSDPGGIQRFRVMRFPIISSKDITGASVRQSGPGEHPTLLLHLDRHGQFAWMQACAQRRGDPVAVLLDGFFACEMTLPRSGVNAQVIELHGTWSAQEAEAIAHSAADNYRKMNRQL